MPHAADAARAIQPIWGLVPAAARGRYLRRAAQDVLDDLDALAVLIARETGRPRTEALLAELLPSVAGLHALADDGPGVLADRRVGRLPALRAGRRSLLVRAPLGITGVRALEPSPWLTPVMELGASLLSGNGAVLEPPTPALGERIVAAFVRSGVPEGLIGVGDELEQHCDAVIAGEPPGRKGTMLVLEGAPTDRVIAGALGAAYAGAGRGPAAVGRIVASAAVCAPLVAGLDAGARRLVLGDPTHAETEVGPLPSAAMVEQTMALVAEAVGDGAELRCGGPATVPGAGPAFLAPVLLVGVPASARLLHEPVVGPVLAVVEADDDDAAIAAVAARRTSTVSVWTGDRRRGERIARALPAALTFVNEHGVRLPNAEVRLARHTEPRQLGSQPARLRSARWLPYDASLVAAAKATARVLHGREHERLAVLRGSARPLARTAIRVARELTRG